jgi:lysophospholipase L1-like esterase
MNLRSVVLLLLFPLLAKTEKVLVIGDSHTVGAFGEALVQELRAGGAEASRFGIVGATPRTYLTEKSEGRTLLSDLLRERNPDTVIVALGENMIDYRGGQVNRAALEKGIEPMLAALKMAGKKCTWVLPTWTDQEKRPPYQKSNDLLKRANALMKDIIGSRCQPSAIDSTARNSARGPGRSFRVARGPLRA